MSELHVAELQLRKMFAGELQGNEAAGVKQHMTECGSCRAKLRSIEEEQQKFENVISLERFRAGVERTARGGKRPEVMPGKFVAFAAAAMIAVFASPFVISQLVSNGRPNGIKGGATVDLHIASEGNGPQRVASTATPELLSPGDRVRIGYHPDGHRYLAAVSVDEAGEVTPLYPANGPALPVENGNGLMPDSIEFTGKGAETVVVLFTDGPIDMRDVVQAAKDAYARSNGNVEKLPDLFLPGEQVKRTVIKP